MRSQVAGYCAVCAGKCTQDSSLKLTYIILPLKKKKMQIRQQHPLSPMGVRHDILFSNKLEILVKQTKHN